MTNRAKDVPCRFEVYWDTKFPKLRICPMLNGDRFRHERAIGFGSPFRAPGEAQLWRWVKKPVTEVGLMKKLSE